MDDKWRTLDCPICRGYGQIWQGEGESDCDSCNYGTMWIRPKGHTFRYPGGPPNGMAPIEWYEKATPVMPYEWHAWTETEEEIDKFIVNRMGDLDEINLVHCECGWSGTIKEHGLHMIDKTQEFVRAHSAPMV